MFVVDKSLVWNLNFWNPIIKVAVILFPINLPFIDGIRFECFNGGRLHKSANSQNHSSEVMYYFGIIAEKHTIFETDF